MMKIYKNCSSWYTFFILALFFQIGCASKKGLVKPEVNFEDKEQALVLFKEGVAALYNDNELAVTKFNQAKEVDKDLLPAFYNAGLAYEQLGSLDNASTSYQECLEKDPLNENCLYNLIVVKYKSNNTQYCEDLVAKYVTDYPEKSITKVALSKLFYLKNDIENAEKNALTALEIETENIEALYLMLRIFHDKKRYRAAKFVAQNALKINPRHAGILLYQGHTFKALDNYQEALDSYAKAVKYEPLPEALENYSKILLKVGKNKEALEQAEKLVLLNPSDSSNNILLGNAYLANKKLSKAQEYYDKALELNNKSAYFNLGLLYFDFKQDDLSELDRYKKAQSYFKEFLASNIEQQQNKIEEAKKYIDILNQKIESEIQLQSFDNESEEEDKKEEDSSESSASNKPALENNEPVEQANDSTDNVKASENLPQANDIIEEKKDNISKKSTKKKKKKKAKKKKKEKIIDEDEDDLDELDSDVEEDY